MIEFFKGWITNIISLAILIVLIEMLIPSGKVKKYVNLISGFILIIAVVNPFISLLKKGVNLKEFQTADSNFLDRAEIEKNSKILEDEQLKQIVDIYRKKIITQVEESVKEVDGISDVTADVIINEDYNSEAFGEIKRVYLHLSTGDENTEIKPVERIEKVEINKGGEEEKAEEGLDGKIRSKIEDKIQKFLDVKKENIIISTQ